jgi:hypothetical protein
LRWSWIVHGDRLSRSAIALVPRPWAISCVTARQQSSYFLYTVLDLAHADGQSAAAARAFAP